ncbi:MAG: hypothetical protein K0R92_374 [Lachnospiraceae bacterium]|jgi:Holliday junction resolvase|nr:hypothetical protein [Lachnospiraceae bacterium]
MLEKELEKKFIEKVKAAGGKAFKFVSPGNDGVPDRLVVLPGGRIGFVELKRRGKKPTKLQAKQIERLKELGCLACVLDRPESIDAVICAIQQNTDNQREIVWDILKTGGLL